MADSALKRSTKAGLPPGTLVHVGEKRAETVKITIMDYDREHLEEKVAVSVEECFPFRDTPTVTWINVDGIHRTDIIEKIGKRFLIHPLTLEDVLNTMQRPKLEGFGDYSFMVLKMLYHDKRTGRLRAEQISILLCETCVISFQEYEGDVFDPIRNRLRKGQGRLRNMGVDFLVYALVDAIVDNCFGILERISEKVEGLEEVLVARPRPETLKTIHGLKRELILLRKSMWPLREVLGSLTRQDSPGIQEATAIYFRDVYDHTVQVIDTIETLREMVSSMVDLYLSSLSNRMNEVMKLLTIVATIFIPLTFVAGLYGMNFRHMPELEWRYGYALVWGVMAVIAAIMLIYFKRKRWL